MNETLKALMEDCWNADPAKRPHFAKIVERLETLAENVPNKRPGLKMERDDSFRGSMKSDLDKADNERMRAEEKAALAEEENAALTAKLLRFEEAERERVAKERRETAERERTAKE